MKIISLALVMIASIAFGSAIKIGSDIDGEGNYDDSGESVALSSDGSIVVIGAPGNGGSRQGHVRLYQRNGSSWSQLVSDIDGQTNFDNTGSSVAISADGSVVAIGTPYDDANGVNSGQVRLLQWWNSSSWYNTMGSEIRGEARGDNSGRSVALSSDGSIVAIGAPYNDINGSETGHVRLYQWDGSWNQLGSDIDGEASGDYSGHSVALSSDGSIVAIGAHFNDGNGSDTGHVRLYQWDGLSWNQLGSDIDGEASGDQFGYSVALSSDGSIVAIGAPYNDINGSETGRVRLYQWDGSWNQLGSEIDGEASGDQFGYSVALSSDGSIVAIGAPYNDGNGSASGRVYFYQWDGFGWERFSAINGEASNDWSGRSVALSSDGSIVAIGAPSNDGNGTNRGHVRLFNIFDQTNLKFSQSTLPEFNDLYSIYLDGSDLSGLILSNINFGGASFSGADLSDTDFRGTDLSDADLSDADLSDADLSGADLSGAELTGAELTGAELTGADLSGADLSGVDLSGADLSGVDLSGSDLSGADLSGADLSGVDLSGADLSGADLSGADLSGAELTGADLSGADFNNAILVDRYLSVIGNPINLPSPWFVNQNNLLRTIILNKYVHTPPTHTTNINEVLQYLDTGSDVLIEEGVYFLTQDFSINYANVTLRGYGNRDNVVINGSGEWRINAFTDNQLVGLTITDCWRGGIYSQSQTTVISNCIVKNCFDGPAISDVKAYNCVIKDNHNFSSDGGAARSSSLYNCIIKNNSARREGAIDSCNAYNCVFIDNIASVADDLTSNSSIENSILVYDKVLPRDPNSLLDYGSVSYKFCAAEFLDHGLFGNITNAPNFVNPQQDNYRLDPSSALIDAGLNYLAETDFDADGNPRIVNNIDIGAYEYQYLGDYDSDGDSISDDLESQLGLDLNNADTDNDGFDDGFELAKGLSPTSADSSIVDYIKARPDTFDISSGGMTLTEAQDAMRDLRVGSQTFGVSNGSAKIRMYVDESSDLTSTWSNTQHVLELDMPADADTKFYRFRMD